MGPPCTRDDGCAGKVGVAPPLCKPEMRAGGGSGLVGVLSVAVNHFFGSFWYSIDSRARAGSSHLIRLLCL